MRKLTLVAMSFMVIFGGYAFGQQVYFDFAGNEVDRCETMEAHERLLQRNPDMETLEEFERWLAPLVDQYKQDAANHKTAAVTTIPVVFHVVHNGEAVGSGTNVSTTYINAQVDQLNYDYRRTPGTSGYNTDARGADSEIEFCMATVDPNGNTLATPGINRINRNAQGWAAPPYGVCLAGGGFDDSYIENTIKPQTIWDPNQYLNIWVMNISCGILGYAQFPTGSGLSGLPASGAANTDGVVLLYSSIGSSTSPFPGGAPYNEGRTATHEVGHWLGLRHIWGDANCGNDYCGDTPQASGPASGCPNKTTCDGNRDMVENYMDYSYDNCMNIFTNDQKTRMQTVLANSPRRNTLGTSSACGGGGGGPVCTTTISTFPYAESFEGGFGAWSQGSGDDFDWSRQSGGTPSSNTGPTAAAAGSFYVFTEVSSPNYPSKSAFLVGPCFDLSGKTTAGITFQYHMYGAATMGSLVLEVSENNGPWTSVWTRTGTQGNQWNAGTVDLSSYVGSTVQLRFVGSSGDTWQGDIAVDDIAVTATAGVTCGTTINSFPYSESFETSFGGWTQSSNDDFDWSRTSAGTPSTGTGPTAAAAGSWYVFTESSSPNFPSKGADLISPCFNLNSASVANLSFQYHMYGAAMGTLVLQVSADGGNSWTSVWSRSGDQGNAWLPASVNLGAYTGNTIVMRFSAVTGTNYTSDFAIDDVELTTTSGGGGGCTNTITAFPYTEGFESGWGAWTQSTGDDFDWSRNSGGTPSSNTGPTAASEGSWYVYTEVSSPNYPAKTAYLEGPCFNLAGVSNPEVGFQYHMYGAANMGSLELQAKTSGGSWTTIWSQTGNLGNTWNAGNVSLAAYAGSTVQLRFAGSSDATWQGDIAVDDIFVGSATGPGCADVTLTFVFDNYPEETSWEIKSGANVVASGGTYPNQPDGSTLVETICLPDGCYDLVVYDAYGDGICCAYGNGSYTLRNQANQILASGGSFTSSETTAFCLSGGNRDGVPTTSQAQSAVVPLDKEFGLYPNPTSGLLNVVYRAAGDTEVQVKVVDPMGRIVMEESWNLLKGMNEQSLRIKDASNGTYMLMISNGEQQLTERFVVIR